MPKQQTLTVFANPYGHLDHEGRLAGACQREPEPTLHQLRHVGAEFHPQLTKVLEKFDEGDARGSHRQDTVMRFGSDVVTLPKTTYYVDRIRDGELFLSANGNPPWIELAKARNAAVAKHVAETGEKPDASFWQSEQYPLDADVAKIAEALAAKVEADAKADVKKREGAAKSSTDDVEKSRKKAEEARAASHRAALDAFGPVAPTAAVAPAQPTDPSGGAK